MPKRAIPFTASGSDKDLNFWIISSYCILTPRIPLLFDVSLRAEGEAILSLSFSLLRRSAPRNNFYALTGGRSYVRGASPLFNSCLGFDPLRLPVCPKPRGIHPLRYPLPLCLVVSPRLVGVVQLPVGVVAAGR